MSLGFRYNGKALVARGAGMNFEIVKVNHVGIDFDELRIDGRKRGTFGNPFDAMNAAREIAHNALVGNC